MNSTTDMVEALFGGRARVAVLRVLAEQTLSLTGRQVADLAGVSQPGAARVLEHLALLGVVSQRRVGRAILHELERENPMVQSIVIPVFEAEQGLLGVSADPPAETDPFAQRVNPRVRPHVAAVEAACRRHHIVAAALFGSATQPDSSVVPSDLDVLVTFAPLEPRMKAEAYAALSAELEAIMGMPVDVMVSTALRNPLLAQEIERTKVVLYEAA